MSTPSQRSRPRERLSPEDRRKQLVRIGLSILADRPIQELSVDEVAAQAGISRGLLFHYFPTKSAYYAEVVAAAGRRVLRNVTPDFGGSAQEVIDQVVRRYFAQIERRRKSYVALVYGQVAEIGEAESPSDTLRKSLTDMVIEALELEDRFFPVVHAWIAYVEDQGLQWSAVPPSRRQVPIDAVVEDCVSALQVLLARPRWTGAVAD